MGCAALEARAASSTRHPGPPLAPATQNIMFFRCNKNRKNKKIGYKTKKGRTSSTQKQQQHEQLNRLVLPRIVLFTSQQEVLETWPPRRRACSRTHAVRLYDLFWGVFELFFRGLCNTLARIFFGGSPKAWLGGFSPPKKIEYTQETFQTTHNPSYIQTLEIR